MSVARRIIVSPASSLRERVFGFFLLPYMRVVLYRYMTVTEDNVALSVDKIESIVQDACDRLGDGPVGSRFLAGDTFSAADIAFSAHFGLILAPPENVYLQPYLKQIGNDPQRSRLEALQQSKAADFVRWCYQHKRPPMV
jgi:glutathione S-transferase